MSINPEHENPPSDPTRVDGADEAAKSASSENRSVENSLGKIKAGAVFRQYRPKPVAPADESAVPPPAAPTTSAADEPTAANAPVGAPPSRLAETTPAALTFGSIFKGGRNARPSTPSEDAVLPPASPMANDGEKIFTQPVSPAPASETPEASSLSASSPPASPMTTSSADSVSPANRPAKGASPRRLTSEKVEPASPAVSLTPDAAAATVNGPTPSATPLSESPFLAAHRILVAARQGAAASEAGGEKLPEPASGDENNPASEAIMNASRWPALVRAAATLVRRTAIWFILLGLGYYGTRTWLIPLVQELRNPGKTDAIHDKAAPTAVRVVQQTRQVVAKNDARVEELNSIIVDSAGVKAVVATPPPPAPPPVAAPVVVPVLVAPDRGTYQAAVDRLKIAGVFSGDDPRINIDGRLFKYGEIVERTLGLRFIGIDPVEHVLLFSNGDSVTFKKSY